MSEYANHAHQAILELLTVNMRLRERVKELEAQIEESIEVRCGCGLNYNRAQFSTLTYVGIFANELETLTLRNCVCGTTLSLEV